MYLAEKRLREYKDAVRPVPRVFEILACQFSASGTKEVQKPCKLTCVEKASLETVPSLGDILHHFSVCEIVARYKLDPRISKFCGRRQNRVHTRGSDTLERGKAL